MVSQQTHASQDEEPRTGQRATPGKPAQVRGFQQPHFVGDRAPVPTKSTDKSKGRPGDQRNKEARTWGQGVVKNPENRTKEAERITGNETKVVRTRA